MHSAGELGRIGLPVVKSAKNQYKLKKKKLDAFLLKEEIIGV